MRDYPMRMGDDLESESVVTARCGTSGCRDGMLRRCGRLGGAASANGRAMADHASVPGGP